MKTGEAQEKALEIEGKLRERDLTMGYRYQEAAVRFINLLKNSKQLLKPDELVRELNSLA